VFMSLKRIGLRRFILIQDSLLTCAVPWCAIQTRQSVSRFFVTSFRTDVQASCGVTEIVTDGSRAAARCRLQSMTI
jgi:hypothetical protein